MLTEVQEALHDLEIIRLVRDVEKKLVSHYRAQQPECVDPEIHRGHWRVWISNYGWINLSDLLKGKIQ